MQTFESETMKMRICDIANYWPGMHKTMSKDIFTDPCENHFDNIVMCTRKM